MRVSEGIDASPAVVVSRPMVLKGGFDPTFTNWAPDRHRTRLTGRVVMSHDDAVLGGFHLLRRTADRGALVVSAGTWLRNFIELQLLPTPLGGSIPGAHSTYYGVVAAAAAGRRVVLRCNDVVARLEATGTAYIATPQLSVIALGNIQLHNGSTTLDANRVCLDAPVGTPSTNDVVVSGYGSCLAGTPASVWLTNNVFEGRATRAAAVHFSGCMAPLDVLATNNTTLTTGAGVAGSSGSLRWSLVNNVIGRVLPGPGRAVDLGSSPTVLGRLEGNVAFGWADAQPQPAPLVASSNELGAAAGWAQVFVAIPAGDFRPLAGGPATRGALNVFGEAASGDVRTDLEQQPRPGAGAWVRGALLP
ncbi:MAG: hypothetical protein JNJ54_31045 [Myxococcaceae bacterium]|nr:hypothetical protein [Myxococcaceae bacterium]